MFVSITDEIIDAIIQNETRHGLRPGRQQRFAPAPRTSGNRAELKPDWGQLPPGALEAGFPFSRTRA